MGAYWTQWYSEAKVVGQESVSVPAGRFTATKVEVWSSRRSTGSSAEAQLEPVRVRYLVWYAPEAKSLCAHGAQGDLRQWQRNRERHLRTVGPFRWLSRHRGVRLGQGNPSAAS